MKKMKLSPLSVFLALLSYIPTAFSVSVTINNTAPRLDNTGTIMDAHDCSIRILPNGTYIMHTIEYGLCDAPTNFGCDQTADHCGFRDNHNVTIWTSNDLSSGSWNYVGYAFDLTSRPAGLIFRPDAIYNPNTGLWVLWYNQATPGNVYVSCVSTSPFGPFTNFSITNVTDSTYTGGDFHLFIDPTTQEGYVIWTAMANLPGQDHKIRINKLTPDWLGITSDPAYIFNDNAPSTTFNEAPMVIYDYEHQQFITTFGHCCCFCHQGSGLFVHTATTPMGPWTAATSVYDIACQAPPTPVPSNPFCANKEEFNNVTVTLVCQQGVIDYIRSFFGTPVGDCPYYDPGPCDDPNFQAYANATCLGQSNCTLTSTTDPCVGTEKSIVALVHCSEGPGGYSPDGPVDPPSSTSKSTAYTYGIEAYIPSPFNAEPTPGQGCLYGNSNDISVTRSQQAFIATVPDGNGGHTYLYIGDMWGSSPDGIKGHEPQYVFPLQFNTDGTLKHITWNNTVTFNINDPTRN